MVVTTDIGNAEEIHPKNKQEVGRRLSLVALSDCYLDPEAEAETKKKLVASGPIYDSMSTDSDRIRIAFKHAKGLGVRTKDKDLGCFLICGEDRKFYPAQATIKGEAVEVTSENVSKPVAVRFAWDDSAEPNLVNGAGLPASPFRTDEFPLQSQSREF